MVKLSKCSFATKEMQYLGHVISQEEVSTDLAKIFAILEWPIPSNVKHIRVFLGITGYYRRFFKNYAQLSQPLVAMLKKNVKFVWIEEA